MSRGLALWLWLALPLLGLGCAHRPPTAPPEPEVVYLEREVIKPAPPSADQQLFERFLVELDEGSHDAFDQLLAEHPDSEWTNRAIKLIAMQATSANRATRLQRELQQEQEEHAQTQAQLQAVAEENRKLVEEREQLKQLMIETERLGRRR